jgi:hypothetical protein
MVESHDAVAVAVDAAEAINRDQSALAWCALPTWEASGFLAFLTAHAIERSDLLKTDGPDDEQRFFRCVFFLKRQYVSHALYGRTHCACVCVCVCVCM